MKKLIFIPTLIAIAGLTFTMSSCYVYTHSVGEGAQSGVEVQKPNHYFLYGLAPGKLSDPTEMAGGQTDYDITIKHRFVDGLLGAITFGIYTPTTTIVQK